MAGIRKHAADWDYDAVTLGLPTPIVHGKPVREPNNLGRGWMKFDFPAAFGKPCKLINDAAMQALGSYEGGRMLFLGLGTGLGSAMVLDGVLIPLELCELPYSPQRTFEDMLGREGRKRLGQKQWEAITRAASSQSWPAPSSLITSSSAAAMPGGSGAFRPAPVWETIAMPFWAASAYGVSDLAARRSPPPLSSSANPIAPLPDASRRRLLQFDASSHS